MFELRHMDVGIWVERYLMETHTISLVLATIVTSWFPLSWLRLLYLVTWLADICSLTSR